MVERKDIISFNGVFDLISVRLFKMEIRIRIILFSFFVHILCSVGESGKILFFAPFVSKSIVITYSPILRELAKKGHQVSIL